MKSDGTWSNFVPVATYRAPLPVNTSGTVLTGTDPNTGIGFTYAMRSIDLGNQLLSAAVPNAYSINGNLWQTAPLTTTSFTEPTSAYEGLLSYNADQIVLPVWVPACQTGTIGSNGEDCNGNGVPAVMEDGVVSQITGDPTVTYTSVQQVITNGLDPQARSGGFGLTLTADGHVTFQQNGGALTTPIGTWSVYSGNPNVIVLNIPTSAFAQLGTDPILNPVYDGAKMIVALRNGHLRMGWLYPSTYAQRTYQFSGALNAQLLQGVQQATTPQ